jgi:hypothetical protein
MKPIAGTRLMRYRWAVLSRCVAGIVGGYALAAASAAALAVWLPMSRVEAVTTATMLAFAIYAMAVMGVFAARNAWRAWAGLLLWTGFFAGLYGVTRLGAAA